METCIIVPSHINNINRTKMLISCLQSLINQTIKTQIYISISFASDLDKKLFNKLIEKNNFLNNKLLCFLYQEKQTSQFRHIERTINIIKTKYNYVLFCDDDDTYNLDRVEKFISMLQHGIDKCQEDNIFAGAYERDSYSHSQKFYEYWSYCVNINIIINFFNIIKTNNYEHYIDNKMCDVLFSTYLRFLDNNHLFVSINEKLYNYNKNEYSITGQILKNKDNIVISTSEPNFEIFIQGINKILEDNMENIKNNIFITYSMCKVSFEKILNEILQENYIYKNSINPKILEKIKNEYDNIKCLCELLYQYKQ